jgi:hypothetical protein
VDKVALGQASQHIIRFLGAFAKLRKATISFIVSVRPSVRMELHVSHWTIFINFGVSRFFSKIGGDTSSSIKI